jgi:hypothetical protein
MLRALRLHHSAHVWIAGVQRPGSEALSAAGLAAEAVDWQPLAQSLPHCLQHTRPARELVLGLRTLPALLGRGAQAQFLVDDASTSRSHAQLEWRGQSLLITDLSSNGTHVRFSDGELVTLRRSSCVLHGRGQIGLGRLPEPGGSATVDFELIRFALTRPVP